jgi:hypothetical protein
VREQGTGRGAGDRAGAGRVRLNSAVGRAPAVIAGALAMCWPALWNGYPLLYPDSISYVDDGRGVLQALLHRGTGFAGMRSEMYSLGIYLVHWKRSPWPVVGMQALIVAWVVWLVVRALLPRRPVLAYLAIIVALAGMCWGPWRTWGCICWSSRPRRWGAVSAGA